ncbi:MAG: hypothetical protein R3F54_09620 [Alphaproteobacteria bacterium]
MSDDQGGASAAWPARGLLLTLLAAALWINASEVFRYFVFVMPMMRDALSEIADVAPMNLPVFLVWGLWDMLLLLAVCGFVWLYLERFGWTVVHALIAGTLVWGAIFGILWLGLFNMNLATPSILAVALPLSWLELTVAALIVCQGRAWSS